MADFTKCTSRKCLSFDFCDRATATASAIYQSYSTFGDDTRTKEKCDWYIPNEKGRTFQILAGEDDTIPF